MNLEQSIKHIFGDVVHDKEKRKRFNNKEAADAYSESLKHLWPTGIGLVYGAFCSIDINHGRQWWEVSYEPVIARKHTPGPWTYKKWNGYSKPAAHMIFTKEQKIATVNWWPEETDAADIEIGVANAVLISAAPDLLQAAIFARSTLESMESATRSQVAIKRLNDAIAKATQNKI